MWRPRRRRRRPCAPLTLVRGAADGAAAPQPAAPPLAAPPAAGGDSRAPWAALLASVRGILPEATWKSLTPELYLTFWALAHYDIHVPLEQCARARACPGLPRSRMPAGGGVWGGAGPCVLSRTRADPPARTRLSRRLGSGVGGDTEAVRA